MRIPDTSPPERASHQSGYLTKRGNHLEVNQDHVLSGRLPVASA